MNHDCPCQSKTPYQTCCARFIEKKQLPQMVEELMRSRYTAYTQENWNYIYKSWDKDTRPNLPSLRQSGSVEWKGLKVTFAEQNDNSGIVEFEATYSEDGVLRQITERSEFSKNKGRWVYVDQLNA